MDGSLRGLQVRSLSVAVCIPCKNEASSVAQVVRDFREELPLATIYVYDNASSDSTAIEAIAAGATVRHEPRAGKGNVVRRMFADVEADIFVMVDGDDTYDSSSVPAMIKQLVDGRLDMVTGIRVARGAESYRRGHQFGNRIFSGMLAALFGGDHRDVFSGYRVLSRRFVKSFPAISHGFEIETELTAHARDISASTAEYETDYGSRDDGSESKLRTYRDGIRIMARALLFYKEMKPSRFFGFVFSVLSALGLVLLVPVIDTYAATKSVPRYPTLIAAVSILIVAAICLASGIILDSIARGRREMKRLHYLSLPSDRYDLDDC